MTIGKIFILLGSLICFLAILGLILVKIKKAKQRFIAFLRCGILINNRNGNLL